MKSYTFKVVIEADTFPDGSVGYFGFIPARQRGSHHRYEHPDGRKVTVPFPSPGDPFLPLSINPPAGR